MGERSSKGRRQARDGGVGMSFTPPPGFRAWPWSKNGWFWGFLVTYGMYTGCRCWDGFIPVHASFGSRGKMQASHHP